LNATLGSNRINFAIDKSLIRFHSEAAKATEPIKSKEKEFFAS
jgi:hypothetical protein